MEYFFFFFFYFSFSDMFGGIKNMVLVGLKNQDSVQLAHINELHQSSDGPHRRETLHIFFNFGKCRISIFCENVPVGKKSRIHSYWFKRHPFVMDHMQGTLTSFLSFFL